MNNTSKRGFASMSKERVRMIAAKGGRSTPPEKRSFSYNQELARTAGRKGGKSNPPEKRSFSLDRELAKRAGLLGVLARSRKQS